MTLAALQKQPKACDSHNQAAGFDCLRPARLIAQPFRATRCRAQAVSSSCKTTEISLDRRDLLLAVSVAPFFLARTLHAEGETKILNGKASPPTSYGGYGGNAAETTRYTYEYPANWKVEVVGKQEKGMVGIDSRVRNPKTKLETAFTVTFGRSGEDNKRFKLGDVEGTLQGFAGADYQLQDCLIDSTNKKSGKRIKDEQEFYDYEVFSPDFVFLASVGLKGGKVYALFVKSPAKMFKQNEQELRNIIQTFTLV